MAFSGIIRFKKNDLEHLPTGEIIHFKAISDDYTSILATELALNLTKGRELFGRIRNESTCYSFSAQSMNDRSRLFYRANLSSCR